MGKETMVPPTRLDKANFEDSTRSKNKSMVLGSSNTCVDDVDRFRYSLVDLIGDISRDNEGNMREFDEMRLEDQERVSDGI